MSEESTLRKKAREAIQAGLLPNRRPDRMWGGRGDGADCAICARAVKQNELGFELEFAGDGAEGGSGNFPVHIRCFAAWEFERDKCEASGGSSCALSGGGFDGTISGCDRNPTSTRGPE